MKPAYEQVALDFKHEPSCVVANVDADAAANKPLAQKYGVSSFPTIKFFPKGNKDEPISYDGERNEEAFVQFLNERCGTRRSVGGLLDETAGRHAEFDSLASRFVTAVGGARNKLVEDATLLASAFGPQFKYYVRVMEKVLNGTEDYIEKESSR